MCIFLTRGMMTERKEVLLVVVVYLILAGLIVLGAAPNSRVLDDHLLVDSDGGRVRHVVEALCSGQKPDSSQRISRLTTIRLLINYLQDELPSAGKLAKCYGINLTFLRQLSEVIAPNGGNVCNAERIDRIASIHGQYIGKKRRKNVDGDEPSKLLIQLFMQFSHELADVCRQNLLQNIAKNKQMQSINREELLDDDPLSAGQLLSNLQRQFKWLGAAHDFHDVVFVWDLLGDHSHGMEMVEEKQTPEDGGRQARLFVKIRHAQSMNLFQWKCEHKFRPIYGQLVLPAVRLAQLGYGRRPAPLPSRPAMKAGEHQLVLLLERWLTLAQICQAISPIKFLRNPSPSSSSSEQMIVINREEAEELESSSPGVRLHDQAKLDLDLRFTPLNTDHLLKQVAQLDKPMDLLGALKANREACEEAKGRLMRGLRGNLLEEVGRRGRALLMMSRPKQHQVVDLGQLALQEGSLEQLDERELVELTSETLGESEVAAIGGPDEASDEDYGETIEEDSTTTTTTTAKPSLLQKITGKVTSFRWKTVEKVDKMLKRMRVQGRLKRKLLKFLLGLFGVLALVNILLCLLMLAFLKG